LLARPSGEAATPDTEVARAFVAVLITETQVKQRSDTSIPVDRLSNNPVNAEIRRPKLIDAV
jgi:hypothetical protein